MQPNDCKGGNLSSPAMAREATRVRPLKDTVILYADDSIETARAKEFLEAAGVFPFVTDGPVEPLQRKPLVIYGGGYYQGLHEIRGLLDLLEFWSNQPIARTIFK